MSDETLVKGKCLLCEQDRDSSIQKIQIVPGYNFNVCWTHKVGNKDGWGKFYEETIMKHMEKYGIRIP